MVLRLNLEMLRRELGTPDHCRFETLNCAWVAIDINVLSLAASLGRVASQNSIEDSIVGQAVVNGVWLLALVKDGTVSVEVYRGRVSVVS